MKNLLFALSVAVAAVSLGLAPTDVEAKRLGGGKAAGMQRQAPPANATNTATPPTTANAPTAAAAPAAATTGAAAAAAAPKRSWMGPLAGLAAGIGLAALFSHLGMGEGLANFMMMALLAVAAFIAIRFIMSRFAGGGAKRATGPQLAGAGAPMGGWQQPSAPPTAQPAPMQRSALQDAPAATGASTPAAITLPGGMAADDFERLAKMVFIRMQAANDAGNVDDLRKFTTPELFASLRLDLQERGTTKQQTDVVQIDAQVVETAQEKGQDIVTVRFTGLIREAADAGAEPFNELWHLVRPADGSGDWAIAGITPVQ
ncbi:MAG: TIM44-like domain-containing protein [Aquabacterium sp.]|nr:TIM44-like domain-containing protein [Aquabacterium sp.]